MVGRVAWGVGSALAAAAPLLLGCSSGEEVPPIDLPLVIDTGEGAEPEETPAPPAYRAEEVTNGGALRGTVRIAGPRPRPEAFEVARQHRICGHSQPSPVVTVGPTGTLADAVVWIDGLDRGRALEPPEEPPTVVQSACRFAPHVLAVARGQRVLFRSEDPIVHNVHARFEDGHTWFDVGHPRPEVSVARLADRTGVARVVCDAGHPWELAWVHVFDHPYFAVTGRDGAFELEGLPAGEHTLRVWHAGWSVLRFESGRPVPHAPVEALLSITVVAGQTLEVPVELDGRPPEDAQGS